MDEFLYLLNDTWRATLLISALTILTYFLIRRSESEFIHVLEIFCAVGGLVMLPSLFRNTYIQQMCNNDFERAFLIIGFLATGWQAIRTLKSIFSKSQPH
jgi:hypothetical protein